MSKLSYSVKEAAEATGLSPSLITKAINAGDIKLLSPRREGKVISVRLIATEELKRWLEDGSR